MSSPDEWWIVELENHHESERDEKQPQVEEDHEAAARSGVGAARMRSRHRLHN